MFYFEFQHEGPTYSPVFVVKKTVDKDQRFQWEELKFTGCPDNEMDFTGEISYDGHFFTKYCVNDLEI
jgi:hypothetical protein